MIDYVISTREERGAEFIPEPGPPRYLAVSGEELPGPDCEIQRGEWVGSVMSEAKPEGSILVWIHGYANGPQVMIERHRKLKALLAAQGWNGALVSFDWPADDKPWNYVEDRRDGKRTAWHLVDGGIRLFVDRQRRGCDVQVHILAHSAGAYVLREAFDDADDRLSLAASNWTVGQVLLIGADVSQRSMIRHGKASSLYRHCVRLTNYQTPQDRALALSNVKRAGCAPRAGRVGLPGDIPGNAVNVNCSALYEELHDASSHSWYFDNETWAADAVLTLKGEVDREHLPTRFPYVGDGLWLMAPE